MNRFALTLSLYFLLASTPLALGDDEVLFYVHNKTSTPRVCDALGRKGHLC